MKGLFNLDLQNRWGTFSIYEKFEHLIISMLTAIIAAIESNARMRLDSPIGPASMIVLPQEEEVVGDKLTIEVREALDHCGDTIVRGAYDGQYDKTNLPKELILTSYFSVRDSKIVSLVIIFNQPSPF